MVIWDMNAKTVRPPEAIKWLMVFETLAIGVYLLCH
jgi:hypothetical protein